MMETEEQIRKTAYELLIVPGPSGQSERWLWDRACRVARHVETIARLPELRNLHDSLDLVCLKGAAYLADVGLPVYAQAREMSFMFAMLELGRPELREFSLQLIREKLFAANKNGNLDTVCRIISESHNRHTHLPEARILSDARNLEDMGMVGVIQDIRRCLLQGKGISAILEGWKRKIDYQYWQARLKEDFHFESVRKLARQRFITAESCMRALEAEDLGKISADHL